MCTKIKPNLIETNDSNHTNPKTPASITNGSRDGTKENLDTQSCKSPSQSSSKSKRENSRISTPDGSAPRPETKPVQDKENQDYDRKDHLKELAKIPNVKNTSFSDVFGLKTHLDYVHRLKLCDLCLTHNKLFPFEFSYYDTNKLHKHKLEGEINTSHRGHPNCRLCGDSFFNQDDLIMHMSREHFYCHLCNHENERRYFNDYEGLRVHFKKEHYLCERDSCREERFTSVFSNEIEYTIHMVHAHGPADGSLSRAESRQFRTIMVPGLPHTRPTSNSYQGRTTRRGDRHGSSDADSNNRQPRDPRVTMAPVNVSIIQQRLPTSADFPTLDGAPNSTQSSNTNSTTKSENHLSNSVIGSSSINTDQGPSTSSGSSTLSQRVASGSSRNSFVRSTTGTYGRAPRLDEQDFPPLPEAPKPTNSTKKGAKVKSSTNAGSATETRNGFPTIDQLLTASLAQAARQQVTNKGGKNSSKQRNGNSKNHKQKPIKIQLS